MYRLMKKLILGSTLVLALTQFVATQAVAAEKKTTKTTTVSTSSSSSYSDSKMRLGLGFASYGAPGTSIGLNGTVSVMMEFNDMTSLQPFFAISSVNPSFQFSVGAILRHTLHGHGDNGFHGGLGFNLGTAGSPTTSFFVNIFPVVGYHFSLGGHVSNLKLSFDMGPIFAVTPSPFNFGVVPLNAMGGASLHYMF